MSTDIGCGTRRIRRFSPASSAVLTAQAFRSQFYSIMASDARLSDEVRYAILQRVIFALEDLVLDADLPEGKAREEDEIDEPTFRMIVECAAHDLAHRPGDWVGARSGDHHVVTLRCRGEAEEMASLITPGASTTEGEVSPWPRTVDRGSLVARERRTGDGRRAVQGHRRRAEATGESARGHRR